MSIVYYVAGALLIKNGNILPNQKTLGIDIYITIMRVAATLFKESNYENILQ